MIITIDGPVATGKSSVAKRLAEQLGYKLHKEVHLMKNGDELKI